MMNMIVIHRIGSVVVLIVLIRGERTHIGVNFGVVSYYIKDKGYMGGQKRLKFSEICVNNNG